MNRRQFLASTIKGGASLCLGNMVFSCAQAPVKSMTDRSLLKDIEIIDAHAHPNQFYSNKPSRTDDTSTIQAIKAIGMAASAFAAVGDQVFLSRGRITGSEYQNTRAQLPWVESLAKSGDVKYVRKGSDVPKAMGPNDPTGAILALEGGDPLEGKPERVNEFYDLGIRMITLVHYRNNELGDIMRAMANTDPGPNHNGLTPAGRRVVERMQDLGMVVDVAHAHPKTLRQIAEASHKPLVDSHTSPCPDGGSLECGRFRSWQDMELLAKTGGVVCTWPFGFKQGAIIRRTFSDWAREILEMKKRVGIDHVGLGTDGGGGLPGLIDGYRDVRDLVNLVVAMQDVGLPQEDIRSFMGGNINRVLKKCIG